MTTIDLKKFNLRKYNSILKRGLCSGVGDRDGQMCIEAAICTVLDLPHGDDPGCVSAAVRAFKIALNDCNWSTPEVRANGLRKLGLAQLGSKDVVSDVEFSKRLAEKIIRTTIPRVLRGLPACIQSEALKEAADRCEKEGTESAAASAAASAVSAARSAAESAAESAAWSAARSAASAAWSAAASAVSAARSAAESAAESAAWSAARSAASAAWSAARSAASAAESAASAAESAAESAASAAESAASAASAARDKALTEVADLGLEVLVELNSPGVALLKKGGK